MSVDYGTGVIFFVVLLYEGGDLVGFVEGTSEQGWGDVRLDLEGFFVFSLFEFRLD